MRRSMKTEQLLACFQRDLDGWLELSHKGHVVFRELRERPGSACCCSLVCSPGDVC
jgi:hypothetical protein